MTMLNKNLLIVLIFIVIILICVGIYIVSLKNKSIATYEDIQVESKIQEKQEEPVTIIFLNEKIDNEEENDGLNNNQETHKEKLAKTVDALKNRKKNRKEEEPEETREDEILEQKQEEQVQQTPETYIEPNSYYIKVNYTANVVNVYSVDTNGNLVECVKAFTCSTGTATPASGVYKTDYKYRWISLFGNVYGQYGTRIVGNILFHSVPYTENENKASLEYWEYDKLGTSASAGCVRLTVEDAKWIYENCKSGTSVEFYSDENPGPLRKTRNNKNI